MVDDAELAIPGLTETNELQHFGQEVTPESLTLVSLMTSEGLEPKRSRAFPSVLELAVIFLTEGG